MMAFWPWRSFFKLRHHIDTALFSDAGRMYIVILIGIGDYISIQILTNELKRFKQNKYGGVSSNCVERDFENKPKPFVVDVDNCGEKKIITLSVKRTYPWHLTLIHCHIFHTETVRAF